MHKEKSLILIKPDAVQRGLIGKIIARFEDAGLKIVGMKMILADDEKANKHYHLEEEWAKQVYEKTKKVYEKDGKKFEYKDHKEHGSMIQSWLVEFLKEGPVVALVLEGPHAIELVRKIVGATEPRQAAPGTIRGDLASVESYALADNKKRVLRNLIHASDTVANAKREIAVWFAENELYHYTKDIDKHY